MLSLILHANQQGGSGFHAGGLCIMITLGRYTAVIYGVISCSLCPFINFCISGYSPVLHVHARYLYEFQETEL